MACTRTTTTPSCGHALDAQSHTCPTSTRPSCNPREQKRYYLHDTCAKCDPEHQRKHARDLYEWQHAQLMGEFLRARAAGDAELMRVLEDKDAELLRNLKARICMVALTRQGLETAWPELKG